MRRWEDYVGWNIFDWSSPKPPVFKEPPGPITNREILEVRPSLAWFVFRTLPRHVIRSTYIKTHFFLLGNYYCLCIEQHGPPLSEPRRCENGGVLMAEMFHGRTTERRCGKIRNPKWRTWTGGCGSCSPGKLMTTLHECTLFVPSGPKL